MLQRVRLRGLKLSKTDEGIKVSSLLTWLDFNDGVIIYREMAHCDLDSPQSYRSLKGDWVKKYSEMLLRN
jgi:hypothetical protein